MVTNHGCTIMTRKQSSSLCNGRRRPLRDRKKNASSLQQHQVNADLFFDIREIVHMEFVPPGRTISVEFYCEVLR